MPRGLGGVISMFTIIPVRGGVDGRRILVWLPVLGLALGAASGLLVTAVRHGAPHAVLVGALLGVAALAALTRGLHLDGLADTADGLASHQPPERAIEIMRRSDIGPFGVLALIVIVGLDVASLASLTGSVWKPTAALALAAGTGRIAALWAAHMRIPAARPGGFGALVAGSIPTGTALAQTAGMVVVGAALAWSVDADVIAWVVVQLAALTLALVILWHARRRFGGVTGDVFGALIETATAAVLVGIAFV
jgi:adenosylcobinamide-GDP ribazoletransferase